MPIEYQDEFKPLLTFEKKPVGTVGFDCMDCVNDLEVPHNAKRAVFNSSELEEIKRVLSSSHPTSTPIEVCSVYAKYSTIRINGKVYGTSKSHVKNTSIIIAQIEAEDRPARIEYFAKVSTVINGTPSCIIMVSLSCFKNRHDKDICGKPVTIWEYDTFDICTISPIHIIKCRTISLVDKLSESVGNVLFVSPYY